MLRFNSGTRMGGTFQAAADAVVDVAGNSLTLSSTPAFQGPGTVRITTNHVVLDHFAGSVDLTGAQVSGQIAAEGILNLQGGSVSAYSSLNVATGGVLNILDTLNLYGLLDNSGTVNWQDGDIIYPYISFQQTTGEIINAAGGIFNVRCDRTISNSSYAEKHFTNAGTLRKSAGNGITEISVDFDNRGAVEGLTGTLRFNHGYSGIDAREFLVTLSRDMSDRIRFSGSTSASLAGKLTVQLEDDYRPTPGDVLPVMVYSGALGDFTCLNGLDLGNGLRLEPRFRRDGLGLVATSYLESAIPEPTIIRSNNGVVISWPNGFIGWELYRSVDFVDWQPTAVAGINNTVKPTTEAKEFFRLQKNE
jgi:hypothetical protein